MPRVSIGLPVYNGERYLGEALESLLAQSFEDFELVVLDNASTDSTPGLVEAIAARDGRVRLVRNAGNIGAAPNFNRVFGLTSGEYFKWAAHDDLCDPALLERCVEALDARPDAVLAHARSRIIGEEGEVLEDYDLRLATTSASAAERFETLLQGHKCFEVFGLIRREALARTPLIGGYARGDGVLLIQLALQGPFVEVPEFLFFPRRHGSQSMTMVGDARRYAEWFDPKHRNRLTFPIWRIHFEYLRSILRAPLPPSDRRACLGILGRSAWQRRRLFRGDVLFHVRRALRPGAGRGASRIGSGS